MEGHICGSLRTQEQTRHMEEWEGGLYEGRSLHSGLLKFNPITLPKKLVMFCCPVSVPWNDQQQKCSAYCTKYMPGTCTSHFSHQLHKLSGHSLINAMFFGKYTYLTLYFLLIFWPQLCSIFALPWWGIWMSCMPWQWSILPKSPINVKTHGVGESPLSHEMFC